MSTARPPRPHDDPGLQPERTSLAWGRTLLSLTVVSALLLRWIPQHGWATALPMAAAVVLALGIWLRQGLRYQRGTRSIAQGSPAADPLEVVAVGGAVVALGALSLLAVLPA